MGHRCERLSDNAWLVYCWPLTRTAWKRLRLNAIFPPALVRRDPRGERFRQGKGLHLTTTSRAVHQQLMLGRAPSCASWLTNGSVPRHALIRPPMERTSAATRCGTLFPALRRRTKRNWCSLVAGLPRHRGRRLLRRSGPRHPTLCRGLKIVRECQGLLALHARRCIRLICLVNGPWVV